MEERMNKYKKAWDSYFEGGLAVWPYFGYQYHSYLIVKHILPLLNVPKEGKVIQMGTALGVAVEYLCFLYGEDRVVGYDLFNPLGHPNIKFIDTDLTVPQDKEIAFLEIDVGSMSDKRENRKNLLLWGMNNMVDGGLILTNRKLMLELREEGKWNFDVIDLNAFDIPELWKNVYETRLNTKVILKINKRKE
tara:strand:- start:1848 stop:2420 length:573 start_codon:yes stop_codon:yes gene_type:complete